MPGHSAVLSVDALLGGAIAIPWEDAKAELELVHSQVRLLTVQYLKQGYHLVVEGPFLFERDGGLISYEAHIDQLLALMRNLVSRSLVVHIEVPAAMRRGPAGAAGRARRAPPGGRAGRARPPPGRARGARC